VHGLLPFPGCNMSSWISSHLFQKWIYVLRPLAFTFSLKTYPWRHSYSFFLSAPVSLTNPILPSHISGFVSPTSAGISSRATRSSFFAIFDVFRISLRSCSKSGMAIQNLGPASPEAVQDAQRTTNEGPDAEERYWNSGWHCACFDDWSGLKGRGVGICEGEIGSVLDRVGLSAVIHELHRIGSVCAEHDPTQLFRL
jgi:hypothetical protein